MANKVFEYYKELPSWAKGVVIVGGLGVTYLFASQIISKIKEDAAKRKAEASLKDANDELKKLLSQGVSLTYPSSQYEGWASQIVEQFKGCDTTCTSMIREYGLVCATDSFKLMSEIVKAMKNDADWLKLVSVFKTRTYKDCFSWINADVTGDLYTCVINELSSSERKALNKALAKSNISYRFS